MTSSLLFHCGVVYRVVATQVPYGRSPFWYPGTNTQLPWKAPPILTQCPAVITVLLFSLVTALAEHEAMTAVVRAASSSGDLPVDLLREYFEVDWNFHHLIFEGTHNPFLIDMSEAISTRVHRMRQTVQTGVSDADDAVLEHRAIVDAFAAGPEAAAAAMRVHIERVRERSRRDSVR